MNKHRFVLLAVVLIVGLCQSAFAQFSGGIPNMPQLPNNGGIQGGNLTPDQLRNLMALRALQARGMGRGQVRTGVPQFIPFGSNNINPAGINNGSFGMPDQSQQTGSTRKSSSQKRAEARAAREEEKKAKAEAAKEKKAQNAQANADPKSKSGTKSKSKSKSTSAKSTASKSKSKSAAKSTSSKKSKSKSDESAEEIADPAAE